MVFLYNENASKEHLVLKGDDFKYIIKVRRHKVADIIDFRNENDSHTLYSYRLEEIFAREARLSLIRKTDKKLSPKKYLHVGWCVIEQKQIEKVLPSLNEIGVSKISFIYCDRSQRNFKIDTKRFHRILKASNQQCGRSDFMEFNIYKNLDTFLKEYKDVKVFDFCDNIISKELDFENILIGCEGGFSKDEKQKLLSYDVFALDSDFVLRSESAVLSIASKILL